MINKPQPTVSVLVHRSRILDQFRAYVRIDGVEAGYRDLRTGVVHCPGLQHGGDAGLVAQVTAPLFAGAPRRTAAPAVYRAVLRSAA